MVLFFYLPRPAGSPSLAKEGEFICSGGLIRPTLYYTSILNLNTVIFHSVCSLSLMFFCTQKNQKVRHAEKSVSLFFVHKSQSDILQSKRLCHLNYPLYLRCSGTCAVWRYGNNITPPHCCMSSLVSVNTKGLSCDF